MKKVFALLLTLALIATLSVMSFAAELPASEGKDLTVGYTAEVAAATVYSVDIVWDSDLASDYAAGTQGAWDASKHEYAATSGAGWTDATVEVKVVNHSNAAVVATVAVVDADANDAVTVAANKTTANLATAVNTAYEAAPSDTFVLTATGTPVAAITKVATATVSFAAANG